MGELVLHIGIKRHQYFYILWSKITNLPITETEGHYQKMQKRVEYDLYYIEHWSLWFDIKIILMTLVKGFGHKNAY